MSREIIRPEQFAHLKSKHRENQIEEFVLTSEEQEGLAEIYSHVFGQIQPGKVVSGTIIKADGDGILVDIGYKSRGQIPKFEFARHELNSLKAGDPIEVYIETLENIEGDIILSYEQAKTMKAWDAIVKLFEEEKPVEGVVTHKVKGGLSVDIGIPAFLPGSQIDLQRVTDFDQYVGQKITANILKINRKRGNVIISRRKHLYSQRSDARKKVLDTLEVGQTIQGIVKNITRYGVFVDIGGVDGLLHIIDMTWGRIAHPSEVVNIGDTITVKVLSFDKENEKISLGLKQLSKNPWDAVSEKLTVGSRVSGKISSITDYGLFVEIMPGIEGLVHISEVSWTDRINDLRSRFRVGETIDVLVASLDKDNKRMSLSIKQLDKNPWEMVNEQFAVSQRIKGKISNITDFGIFVQLLPGVDGLVHISDLSWTEHIAHPGDLYTIGQEVETVILAIDLEQKKISLGIKQLKNDPWENIETQYPVNTIIDGEVSKIANFGAFIKTKSGIEGLVHNTTVMDELGKKIEEVLKVGQAGQFRVINVSKDERKLGLSTLLDTSAPIKEISREKSSNTVQEKKQRPAAQPAAPVAHPKKKESAPAPVQREEASSKQQQQPSKMRGSLQFALESLGKTEKADKDDNDANDADSK